MSALNLMALQRRVDKAQATIHLHQIQEVGCMTLRLSTLRWLVLTVLGFTAVMTWQRRK